MAALDLGMAGSEVFVKKKKVKNDEEKKSGQVDWFRYLFSWTNFPKLN